jgi:hypothetical protein
VTRARRWWPVPLFLGSSLVVQKLAFESRYDVSGHAAEHLSSAAAPFAAAAMIAILLLVTPGARRQPLVLLTSAAWLAATVLVLLGNVRVVDVLVRNGMAHTPTTEIVENADIESAHNLANVAPWFAVLAALALTAALWRYGHVSGRVALGATILNVIFPPWIIPGAGVLVLIVARAIAYERAARPEISATLPASEHGASD